MQLDTSLELDAPLGRIEENGKALRQGESSQFCGYTTYLRTGEAPDQGLNQFIADRSYEACDGVREVIHAVRAGEPVIFVSGRAGTGKSRLIDYLARMPGGDRQVVAAPTGISALALRGSTLHSLFGLPIGVIDCQALETSDAVDTAPFLHMSRLVIDEIGMVRADVMDGVDARLRHARGNDLPFGGVQVVLVGDFLQLPPVVSADDRRSLEMLGYETPFAFSSMALRRSPMVVATLKKVWRQSEPEFIEVLGSIREGRRTADAVGWLNDRCFGPHRSGRRPLIVTARRETAEAYNEKGLAELKARTDAWSVIRAQESGAFATKCCASPAPKELRLAPGVRVIAVRNDPDRRFVNGSLGEVISVSAGSCRAELHATVLFDGSPAPVRVYPAEWVSTKQEWSHSENHIISVSTGLYVQLPLDVAYATTIHRCQGMSLDDVRIDLGRGAFAPGQLYVALSRARSVDGLSLARSLSERDVRVDEMLFRFLEWAQAKPNLKKFRLHV